MAVPRHLCRKLVGLIERGLPTGPPVYITALATVIDVQEQQMIKGNEK